MKFDAIDDGDLISPEDMLQTKIPMAAAKSIRGDPLLKYFPICSKKVIGLILFLFVNSPGDGHINISLSLLEVLIGILFYTSRSGETFDNIIGLRSKIELNQLL